MVLDRFHQSLPGRTTRDITEEANAHNDRNILAEQRVYWKEQGRTRFEPQTKQASNEKVKNASKQLVMKFMLQLHKLPKCLERKCRKQCVLSKINQSKPGLLIKLCFLNEMNCVEGDSLENQRRSLLSEAMTELHKGKVTNIFKNLSKVLGATCRKFKK